MMRQWKILGAGCAAWRARYLMLNGRKVAHICLDPSNGRTPTLSGSVAGREFRLRLPTLHWRYNASPLYRRAYQVVNRFWAGVDGRYGWGTIYWKE